MKPEKAKILSEKITPFARYARKGIRRGSWRIASDLPASFRYAAQGVVYSFVSQRNIRIHIFVGALAFGLGVFLKLNFNHLAVLV